MLSPSCPRGSSASKAGLIHLTKCMAVALAPAYAWWFADWQRSELMAFIAGLVLLRHAGNVRRLLAGHEPKIGDGAVR